MSWQSIGILGVCSYFIGPLVGIVLMGIGIANGAASVMPRTSSVVTFAIGSAIMLLSLLGLGVSALLAVIHLTS